MLYLSVLYICGPCLFLMYVHMCMHEASVLYFAAPEQEIIQIIQVDKNCNASKQRMQCTMVWLQKAAIKTRLN